MDKDKPTEAELRERVQEVEHREVSGKTTRPRTAPDIQGRDVSGT